MAKKIILVFLLVLAFLGYFYLNQYMPNIEKVVEPIETPPIPCNEGEEIHFFSSGFVITDKESSRFYDYEGKPITPPLNDENENTEFSKEEIPIEVARENEETKIVDNEAIIINDSTDNYMIINDKYLYNTSKTPFEFVLEAPQNKAWAIYEFDDSLLIISKSGDDSLEPYIMQKSNNGLYKIDGLEDLAFIDGDYCSNMKALSIIALNANNPFPSTQILHFSNINELYGVLSIDDDIFYNIYRYESFFVVVGLHKIRCYDLAGKLNWEIKIPHSYDNELLTLKDELALYFNNVYIENKNNTIIVTNNGDYKFVALPRGLHHLKKYNTGYIGILDKKTIVKLNSRGDIDKKYEMDTDIDDIYWTPYASDNIYIETEVI